MRIYSVNSVFVRGISNRQIEMNWKKTGVSASWECLLVVCHTITFSLYWMRHFVLLKLVLNWFMAQYVNAKAPQTTTAQTRTHTHIHSNTHWATHRQRGALSFVCLPADYSYDVWYSLMKIDFTVWHKAHTLPLTQILTNTYTHKFIYTHMNYACVLILCCFCRFPIHIADLHPAFFRGRSLCFFNFCFSSFLCARIVIYMTLGHKLSWPVNVL